MKKAVLLTVFDFEFFELHKKNITDFDSNFLTQQITRIDFDSNFWT